MYITGSNRRIEIRYAKPRWASETEAYFMFQGFRCYLSEFIKTPSFANFDGCAHDSMTTGILIKIVEYDHEQYVKAYSFRS